MIDAINIEEKNSGEYIYHTEFNEIINKTNSIISEHNTIKTKVDLIDDGATDDQTASEIKTSLETLTNESRLDVSAIKNVPNSEPPISFGTTNQMLLGDKSWYNFAGVTTLTSATAINLDWSLGSLNVLTMLESTTFTFLNQKTIPFQLLLKGEFSFIFPNGGILLNSDNYNGLLWNLIQIIPISETEFLYSIINEVE